MATPVSVTGQLPKGLQAISRFSPEQQNILSQLSGMGLGGLQQGVNFEPILQRARSQFSQQTVPSLAERFTSLGGGRLSSPSFASQLGQAGAGLEEGLAALQSEQQLSLLPLYAQLLGMGLQPQYDVFQMPQRPHRMSFGRMLGSELGGAFSQGLGTNIRSLLGGLGTGGLSLGLKLLGL